MTTLALDMITLVVADYDDAIAYYTKTMGFALVEDSAQSATKRWVVVDPGSGAKLLLAQAKDGREAEAIGCFAGGRVGLFLTTLDFDRTFADFTARGVRFLEDARHESYGRVAVFSDLYGNKWDLIGPEKTDAND